MTVIRFNELRDALDRYGRSALAAVPTDLSVAERHNALGALMEFDHVVRVHPDGTVTSEPDVWAPELFDEEVWDGWTLLRGYTGQYGYRGPIMHPSEYIGGRLAADILAEPGVYVALVAYSLDDDDADGWAIARRDETADAETVEA